MFTYNCYSSDASDAFSLDHAPEGVCAGRIESDRYQEISFGYVPPSITYLEFKNVKLSPVAMDALRKSNVSEYVVFQGDALTVQLPETSVPIKSIRIGSYNSADYLFSVHIPECENLYIGAKNVVLADKRLGKSTLVSAEKVTLLNCTGVEDLRLIPHGEERQVAVVMDMPSISKAHFHDTDATITGCDNLKVVTKENSTVLNGKASK